MQVISSPNSCKGSNQLSAIDKGLDIAIDKKQGLKKKKIQADPF